MDRVRFSSAAALGMAMLIGGGLAAPPAQAGYVVTLTQEGGDVAATGSGPIDLTGLSLVPDAGISSSRIAPSEGFIIAGGTGEFDLYGPITGPGSFGSGGVTLANSGGGDLVGIVVPVGSVLVPTGYVSDSPLSDTATYAGQTFATLGVTPGKYEWTWGTGANQNFTLDIGVPVPEPSAWALLLTGFAALGAMMRSRRRMAPASI
jgi:large exoprotein involved in heme utilization and adhesion